MAYNREINVLNNSEPLEKDSWKRSTHILNLITYGQVLCSEGERFQNPKIMCDGVIMMLDNIGPLFIEKETVVVAGKEKTITTAGRNTRKFQNYLKAITEAKIYINACMNNPNLSNKSQLLSRAYQLLNAAKMDLLQEASDLGMNFSSKESPYDAWKR